jgi:hypothetical protein
VKHATTSTTKRKQTRRKTAGAARANSAGRRKAVVLSSLLGVLAATTILLKAMAPLPMRPDAADTLFAYGGNDTLNAIFQMQVPVQPDHWHYLYIHQSKTLGGNANTLDEGLADGVADHFIIGNGDGLADGELQISQRWNHQNPAASPSKAVKVDPDCISICIVGDLDRNPPTTMQLARLTQLVQALQVHCRIPATHVEWVTDAATRQAGIGKLFPTTAFHEQLRSWTVGS